MSDADENNVVLSVGGQRHSGWEKIRIVRSLERGAHSFDLDLTDRWDNGADAAKPRTVRTGQPATVRIGNDLVISGYIDQVRPNYDGKSHTIQISGRSKVGDLIDCSLPRKQYKNQNLLEVAIAECKPFGIQVIAQADVGKAFTHTPTRDAGESIFDFLEQLARIRALRLISDINGNLVFTRAGTRRAQTSLVLGKNILSGKGDFSYRDIFSDYTVLAQQPAAGFSMTAEAISTPGATAKDQRVTRYRPRVLNSQQPASIEDCRIRAEWQRNTHYGRGRGVVYTVNNWRQTPGGPLWTPNDLVPVTDAYLAINDDRLIVEVQLIVDDKGRRSEIKVMPKEAFDLVPLPEPKADDEGW